MRIISNNVNVKIGRQITVRDLSQTARRRNVHSWYQSQFSWKVFFWKIDTVEASEDLSIDLLLHPNR